MVEPYTAIALQMDHWEKFDPKLTYATNLDYIEKQIAGHIAWNMFEYPVKLVALPEGNVPGWAWASPEMYNPRKYAREGAISVPGPETDRLAAIARKHNIYLRFQAVVVEPEWPDHHFNKAFIISPEGEIILSTYKHHESYPIGVSATPHDLWDEWTDKYVKDKDDWQSWMDAIYPVVDTPIGKLGTLICGQTSYPEEGRGLAMNGAEVIIKCNLMNPWTSRPNGYQGNFTLLSRMHALVNTAYTISPNIGAVHLDNAVFNIGGFTNIVDYMGQVLIQLGAETGAAASAIIDVEALRKYRNEAIAITTTQLPLMRTENFKLIYEQPIYPKNHLVDGPFESSAQMNETLAKSAALLRERGIYTAPSN